MAQTTGDVHVRDAIDEELEEIDLNVERSEACVTSIQQDVEAIEMQMTSARKEQSGRDDQQAALTAREARLREEQAKLREEQNAFEERAGVLSHQLTTLERETAARKADLAKAKTVLMHDKEEQSITRRVIDKIRARTAATTTATAPRFVTPSVTEEPDSEDELSVKLAAKNALTAFKQSSPKKGRGRSVKVQKVLQEEEISDSIEVMHTRRPEFDAVVRSSDGSTSMLSTADQAFDGQLERDTTPTLLPAAPNVRTSGRKVTRPVGHENYMDSNEAIQNELNVSKKEAKPRRKTIGPQV
ncbi:hypothetical protein LTR56_003706 [Elasticomyces elasticus]|nr:hypothetical protein LTR22_014656 [Elasticomyces elasticus]KAK3654849.1 hypothetical protein LTR56_003706 [Elasticomyces elasticus]KAK4928822.1 hypothetical protein LTR49_004632 [Elasticomyces elasticus]KAK5766552.1 hypothetical protein LTS12_003170 [Elasticomyces elasticus]